MSLSPALFNRLYQSIQQGRESDAVLLLTQLFDHQDQPAHIRNKYFIRGLREMGDDLVQRGHFEEAEKHFQIAFDLYERFFSDDAREGIAVVRRQCELYELIGQTEKLNYSLDRAYEIVQRMLAEVTSVAVADTMQRTGTSNQATNNPGGYEEPIRQRPMRVLLIEDNEDDVGLVKASMESADLPLSLDWAQTLQDGLQRLHDNPVDVVLLDLGLPDSKSSNSTIHAIREDAPRVPIVVLTGNDDRELILEALRTGARDYLIKGKVNSNQLVSSIKTAMAGRVSAQSNAWEQALRLDTLVQSLRFLGAPAFILDTKYSVIEGNREFCAVLGRVSEQIRSISFLELCPNFPRTELDELLTSGGKRRLNGLKFQTTDGQRTMDSEVSGVVDSHHAVRWLVVRLHSSK